MNLALNNAMNVTRHYRDLDENVEIEVVAFGPGLPRRSSRPNGA